MTTSSIDQQTNVYRKMLSAAICSICLGNGFDTIEKDALATLVELLQCFLSQLSLLSRNYCELAGRSEPLVADILLGFIDMGIDFSSFDDYIKSAKYPHLPPIIVQQPPKQPNMLTTGVKQTLPQYIPSYLPEFPVPHAYIRTPTHRQPIIDYESALTKFLAKTAPSTHKLFDTEDINTFPLIACQPNYPPYLSSLLPQDQIFDPEELEYDAKVETETVEHKKPGERRTEDVKIEKIEEEEQIQDIKTEENHSPNNFIDNPYLAAIKFSNSEEMDIS
ncbi:hypothetical protein WA026_002328 [Henosepilachna vigintioctopunctata]|uniref:Transcription initiation factor TFIID subunit 8 n=1 Tax=Henosepilachna vigintioctopunctata TaxID=420089 RepID=A0AAW1U0U7_9CUCU